MKNLPFIIGIFLAYNTHASTTFETLHSTSVQHDLGDKTRREKRIGKKRKRKCKKWARKSFAS